MAISPEIEDLQRFIGFLQPTGLLVAPKALVDLGAVLRTDADGLPARLEEVLSEDGSVDVARLLGEVLRWPMDEVLGAPGSVPVPEALRYTVEERGVEHLVPDFVVQGPKPADAPALLVRVVSDADFDETPERGPGWLASPHTKFERLLRHLKTPVGVLTNGRRLRLIYAPHGEPSGHGTWDLAELTEPTARPLAAGLHLLLDGKRVFDGVPRLLVELLSKSRDYQNTVSNELSEQVLDALWELLAGFEQSGALKDVPPGEVYAGLLKVLMRLVFVLYAEDAEDLLPNDPLFREHYSVRGLFARLERDAGLHPDTMDERYGAWAALLTLFRLIHDGGGHGAVRLPKREGELFNPWRHPFLEGAKFAGDHPSAEKFVAPKVPDGCVFRVLKKLLVVNEERLSYRTLDVEQIGSVYESMMGFDVERARGHVVALRKVNNGGKVVDVGVDLDFLLELGGNQRNDHIKRELDIKLTDKSEKAVKAASTRDELVAAFGSRLSRRSKSPTGVPRILPPGSYFLQPGYERRRSGSHYTPRALTRPIVEKTLEPIFADLGPNPTPELILDLKVCDPAMGSGAFLVETCRQLAEKLVAAWKAHGRLPRIPPDETPELHARRLVAQRCLYGVDRNEFAVSLAKLSLWLVTLARDHSFTFIDHSLRHGDSLLGLDLRQIADFQWNEPGTGPLFAKFERTLYGAQKLRELIGTSDSDDIAGMHNSLDAAEKEVADLRRRGDLLLAAYFAAKKDKARDTKRVIYKSYADRGDANAIKDVVEDRRADAGKPFAPFHWPVEFPEVFGRDAAGFDAIVGNPPFAGKNTTIAGNLEGYIDWLKLLHERAHGNADLVAHFFRRAFSLIRPGGAFGLIATNTISQGDTRETGLTWLVTRGGGTIYDATKRFKWPGLAAVVVSVVHVRRGPHDDTKRLSGHPVDRITAFLVSVGPDESPRRLIDNAGMSFQGSIVLGMGFTFDDKNKDKGASPVAAMRELVGREPQNAERIFPYLGGDEVNNEPQHQHHRFVINFGTRPEEVCRRDYPSLVSIVEAKIRGQRASHSTAPWWQHERARPELYSAIAGLDFVLVQNCGAAPHLAFARVTAQQVFANTLAVIATDASAAFAALQSRVHEVWARFFGSSMKDDLRYTPSDCFETFPLPPGWRTDAALQDTGRRYYEYRADLMKRTQKGLTKTYNRFHNRLEKHPEIVELRRLHEEMDRAVLHAYDWDDVDTTCDFFPDWPPPPEGSDEKQPPYRFRWPDEVRDEVLGLLLAENQRREGTSAARGDDDEADGDGEEAAPVKKAKGRGKAKAAKSSRKKKGDEGQGSLL